MKTRIHLVAILLSAVSLTTYAQSNVPIDSPRGNYVGAENIHWYQQSALKVSDNQGLLPPAAEEFKCRQDSLAENCFGQIQREPQEAYYIQGRVPVKVAVFVDSRSTSGFDYPFRRAVDAIRRTNDAFSRSGVNAYLYITEVRYLNFDARGYSYDAREIFSDIYNNDYDLLESTAQGDEADVVMFVRNTQGVRSQAGDWCGYGTLGLYPAYEYATPRIVLTCEDSESQRVYPYAPTTAPHEFGHVFGLSHESSSDSSLHPHLSFGRGYIRDSQDVSTIMSTEGPKVPFFSSPSAIYEGLTLGELDVVDSVKALNQAAANVGLYWERRYGDLTPAQSGGSTDGSEVNASRAQAAPGSLDAPGVQ